MAKWLEFIESIQAALVANETLAGIPITVGKDIPIPNYPAIRLIRGQQGGAQRLRARHVSTQQTTEVIVETWEGSKETDPMDAYKKLKALEDKLDAALEAWADDPPDIDPNFYAEISGRAPGDETLTRPAVGTKITITIKY